MIVCHCRGITDRTIRSLVQKGTCSLREIGRACAAGHLCGGCRPTIDELVANEQRKKSPVRPELSRAV